MNIIPVIIAFCLLIISLISVTYRTKTVNLILLTIILAIVFRVFPDFPIKFLFLEINNDTILWMFAYTIFVIGIQNRIRHYLVPVMYAISTMLVMLNAIVPYFLMFELIVIVGSVLIILSSSSSLPKLYLPLTLSLSLLTGVSFILYSATNNPVFGLIFVFMIVIRSGLFPLWLMERNILTIAPYAYSLMTVSRVMASVFLLVNIEKFTGITPLLVFEKTAILYIACATLLIASISLNRSRDALSFFSSSMIIPVSLLFIAVCNNLNKIFMMLNFGTIIFSALVLPFFYNIYMNKIKVDNSMKFFEFIRLKRINMFIYIIVVSVLFLPLPISPLLFVVYEIIKNNSINLVIGISVILYYAFAGIVISRLANLGKY